VANLLIDLSEQLLVLPFQKNNSWSSQTPAVSCPFQPLGRLTTTEKSSHQMAQQDMEQVGVQCAGGWLCQELSL
jgi:hypothetical protein